MDGVRYYPRALSRWSEKQRLLSSLDGSYLFSQSHMGYGHTAICAMLPLFSLSDREERYIARATAKRTEKRRRWPSSMAAKQQIDGDANRFLSHIEVGRRSWVRDSCVTRLSRWLWSSSSLLCMYICSAKAKTTNVTVLQISFTTNITGHLDQVATVHVLWLPSCIFFFK
jgi:hypothetical protein